MTALRDIVGKDDLSRADLVAILSAEREEDVALIQDAAERTLLRCCSDVVYWRGLIEFSNVCAMDCLYCGIRSGNKAVRRFTLEDDAILEAAQGCARRGYGSLVLQSGERRDEAFVAKVERLVKRIKEETRSEALPKGLGITLSVGEQSPDAYRRFFEAGAHRYLLRIETTNPDVFRAIHPEGQGLESRLACLRSLHDIGFQVGTGVMIGLPGQTLEMLADDILFMKANDIDMVGMGPYIPHPDTPLAGRESLAVSDPKRVFRLSLLMIGAVRLALKDVNIAATTALQAMAPDGREQGLRFGANVMMPQLTPTEHRRDYLLYPGKPCVNENPDDCAGCLAARVRSAGRRLGLNEWGDSRHFARRRGG